MTANDIHLLTGAYVLDSLDEADRTLFTGHLDECEGCAGEVAELRETVVRLADDSWAVPPPRLRQNVMEQIRATRQLPPVYPLAVEATQPVPPRKPSPWLKRAGYGLAAALLAIVAGGGTYLVQQQKVDRVQAEAAQVEAVLNAADVAVKKGGVLGGGNVTVVSSRSRNAAVVFLADAAKPDPAKAYEFWMIEKGSPRPAALLGAGEGSGRVLVEGLGTSDTLGMTLEKASGATVPTDPILAAIALT